MEALQEKKQRIQQFKNDSGQAARAFINSYENYLDQRIDYEKKRADEDIEFRKREIDDAIKSQTKKAIDTTIKVIIIIIFFI